MLRFQFPILAQKIHGDKRLAYLDNAATTQKPQPVICALCEYYEFCNSNVHRALHELAERATEQYDESRRKVARFIGAGQEESVVFTRGTTESINLVAYAWGRKFIEEGDVILLTEMEHHSNIIPWQILAREKGAKLVYVPVLDDGSLDIEAFHRSLSSKVKLFAVTHMSNVLGTINPVKELADAARAAGARVLVDGAQSAPHMPIDVQDLGVDFFAFSGHKMCAPTGIGALYARRELLEDMDPFMGGGEMINRVSLDDATWAEVPHKFEAGTPNISGAVGLGVAVDFLANLGMDKILEHDRRLTAYTIEKLSAIEGIKIFGKAPERGGAISFEVAGIHPHDLSQLVDREGVAIRAGHMCAQPLMKRLGVGAVSRASVYLYNVEEDVDQLVYAIGKAKDFFKV
ncbi:MAG: cysteine desulfurase [Verrucomicrobia bacterium]|nr:cysteine desulfurase [Verrucomicrobiota bacterium]